MKLFFISIGIVVILLIGTIFILPTPQGIDPNDPRIVTANGLHWHPQLAIYVKDVQQEIPKNLGLGVVHNPIHTHEDLPIIHLEFQGVVRKDDITLGKFFDVWSKDMRSFGANMRMTVNGVENTEYADYIMRDGDQIELRYD